VDKELLPCPTGGAESGVPVDGVFVAYAHQSVTVDASGERADAMMFTELDGGFGDPFRRQYVSLLGWCERGGHEFEVSFRQHEGRIFRTMRKVSNSPKRDPREGL
jgi:hypothetical protein